MGLPAVEVPPVADFSDIVDAFGGLHEGFDAVPKLLGSEQRERAPITGFTSGVKEGAKGVAYGWWDGITGLVTEPIQGGKKEGFVGALKGMGRSCALPLTLSTR